MPSVVGIFYCEVIHRTRATYAKVVWQKAKEQVAAQPSQVSLRQISKVNVGVHGKAKTAGQTM